MDGIVFGESPRWRDGQLWFSDWGAGRVYSIAADGTPTVEAALASFPMCIDFLPDGRLLVVSSANSELLRREPDGSLVSHADLAAVSTKPWNDIVVDGRGNAYVNSIGFDFPGGEFAPGIVVLVTQDGKVIPVADGLAFPNGMAITADGSTLIVAESYAEQLTAYDIAHDGTLSDRRIWGTTAGDHPDGIVWMRPARSGTPMSATSTVCGSAKVAKCSRRSTSTGARLRARSAGAPIRSCSWWVRTGADPMPSAARPARSWPSQHLHPAEATRRWHVPADDPPLRPVLEGVHSLQAAQTGKQESRW